MIHLYLDRIRSNYNVGSLLRTADGAGIDHVYLGGYSAAPAPGVLSKTALGAEHTVPWSTIVDGEELLVQRKKEGWSIVAIEATPTAKVYFQQPVPEKVLYILGNEVDGVADSLLNLVDETIKLPMHGSKHSLNVATAGAIILYHASLAQHYGITTS